MLLADFVKHVIMSMLKKNNLGMGVERFEAIRPNYKPQ